MEKRKCRLCDCLKNLTCFANAGIIKGKQYHRHICKPCYTKFKNIRKNKIKNYCDEIKKKKFCVICGESDFRVLDFDHIKGKKEFNIGDAKQKGFSFEKIKKEIDKCQVLCANCHRRKTWEEQNKKRSVG